MMPFPFFVAELPQRLLIALLFQIFENIVRDRALDVAVFPKEILNCRSANVDDRALGRKPEGGIRKHPALDGWPGMQWLLRPQSEIPEVGPSPRP
jgi:hypothetical protein